MGLGQFGPYILALQEETNTIRTCEPLGIGKQEGQGRQGPGRHHIIRIGGQLFDPGILNGRGETHARRRGLQELAFLGGGFMQGDRKVGAHRRQNQSRETRPGAEIRQGTGACRDVRRKLGAIPEMPPPEIGQGAIGHQVMPGVPIGQEAGISLQPGQCFT